MRLIEGENDVSKEARARVIAEGVPCEHSGCLEPLAIDFFHIDVGRDAGKMVALCERHWYEYSRGGLPDRRSRKDDHGKQMWRLLPWEALSDIVDVLTWACTEKKPKPYPPNGWRLVENAIDRYDDALERHLVHWREARRLGRAGRSAVDKESNLPSLAHAACCVLFLLALDRDPPGQAGV